MIVVDVAEDHEIELSFFHHALQRRIEIVGEVIGWSSVDQHEAPRGGSTEFQNQAVAKLRLHDM